MTNDLPVEPDDVPERGPADADRSEPVAMSEDRVVAAPGEGTAAITGEVVGDEADRSPAGDPFPRERFVGLVGRLPRYLRLAWGLAGEPRLSRRSRAGVLAAAAYLVSPIDAIPGVIPVIGQVDDIAVALLALRAALRALDPATRERLLLAAGLEPDDLDRDLGTLGVVAAWLARRGVAIGGRLGRLAFAASIAAGRAGAAAARRGAPAVARTTTDVVRRGAPAVAHVGGQVGGRAARAGVGAARLGVDAARAGAGVARTRAGAVAGAAGRGLSSLRVRVQRDGPDADVMNDATGEADRDAGAGI